MVSCSVCLFSHAVGREGRCKQISLACVWSIHSVLTTLGLPPHWVCSRSRRVCYTAQAPSCSIGSGPLVACGSSFQVLHKSPDLVGPAFCAFPGPSSLGSQELEERSLPGCSALIPSAVPASVSAHACWVRLVSVLGSWSPTATLPADGNHPESQEVFG